MKKIKILLILLITTVASCKKSFLNETPQSSLTEATFFKTEADFQQALSGAYAAMRTPLSGTNSWVLNEMRSDNTHYDYNNNDRSDFFAQREDVANFVDNATNLFVNEKYNSSYAAIARCNTILSRINEASLPATVVNQITGEAKFIRALIYLELLQYFGDVPLYREEVKSATEAYLQRSPKADVLAFVISEAVDAISKLPAPTFPQNGRANKGSARVLLANAYMVQKDYVKAEAELKSVTNLGYSLQPSYASLFSTGNKNNQESIFEIQYQQGTQGQASNFLYNFIPASLDVSVITGIQEPNRSGGWNIPTGEMIGSYEPGDNRLPASIAIAEGTGPNGTFNIESVKNIVGYTAPPGKIGKPFVRKYWNPHTLPANTDDNWPYYRYADALLLLAEALNEQNKGAEALPYLNSVRTRAGLSVVNLVNQTQLKAIILHERRIELAFENKRWFDLLRSGTVINVMTANGAYIKANYPNVPSFGYNVTQQRLIYAIPFREVQIAGIPQNPGY